MEKIRLENIERIAREILAKLPNGKDAATLVSLTGELGAGKTTLVQAIARELGIRESVQSPTYVLMKSYPIPQGPFKRFVHIDCYRLENKEQFAVLEPEKLFADPATLVCIEWPEKVAGALPKPDLSVRLVAEDASAEERYIEIA